MQRTLTPAERLIVAADFKPKPEECLPYWLARHSVEKQVLALADSLKGTGVYLKVNSALRACGYDLINKIKGYDLRVFADLKLYDIGDTLTLDGLLLQEARPELLTTVCVAGDAAMKALKVQLPGTEILAITVLTSLTEEEHEDLFGGILLLSNVCKLALKARDAGMDGVVCAPTEAADVRREVGLAMTINTPNIRPAWAAVKGDNQNAKRSMTPAEAIAAGANRIVVGRPITQAPNPREAVMRTIEEITSVS